MPRGTPAPPEEKTEEKAEPESEEKKLTASDVVEAVREALGSLLDSGEVKVEDEEETEPEEKPGKTKRMTYRDEEEAMSTLVGEKVKELLAAEKKAGEKHEDGGDEKRKPEPVPAQPAGRRVEKFMGWS